MVIERLDLFISRDNCCSIGFVSALFQRRINLDQLRFGLRNGVTSSASCYSIPGYFGSGYFASSNSLVQSADTQKPMKINLNCTIKEKIDQSGTISYTLGAYVKDFKVSLAFWAAFFGLQFIIWFHNYL